MLKYSWKVSMIILADIMYLQSIPKPPIPPPSGQPPGIWLALSSVQGGIWPKMRPARWGIWLSCQNVCQQSETKGFRNSLIQHVSRVQRSLLSSIPRGLFCCYIMYSNIVISQNMPLFKVWNDDNVNKKFIVAENFTQLVAKGKR